MSAVWSPVFPICMPKCPRCWTLNCPSYNNKVLLIDELNECVCEWVNVKLYCKELWVVIKTRKVLYKYKTIYNVDYFHRWILCLGMKTLVWCILGKLINDITDHCVQVSSWRTFVMEPAAPSLSELGKPQPSLPLFHMAYWRCVASLPTGVVLQFFSIAFTHLANHGSTSSNVHIFFVQQESSLANGLTISHCFHTNFFEF